VSYLKIGEEAILTDEELCRDARNGLRDAEEQLVHRYTRVVRSIARPCFLAGGDGEDLIQEGMLGLINAIREFDPARSSFRTFASLCVQRRIYSAIRQAQGKKHALLNRALSFEQVGVGELGNSSLPDVFFNTAISDPETLVISREETQRMSSELESLLSGFERRVLSLYLNGQSYAEMAAALNRPAKSVDNAVQRIRRKLAHYGEAL